MRETCNCLILYDIYSICAANDAESCEMFIASAPSYRRLLGCTVVIIHMTSFYTEIMYDNESVRLGRGGF